MACWQPGLKAQERQKPNKASLSNCLSSTVQWQCPSCLLPMRKELGRGKQRCGSEEVTSQLMSESLCGFSLGFFFFFSSKTNPPKHMEITSCELFQIQSLGLACVSWLRSSKAFLDRVLLPLKIPLTPLKDSFYKHIKKIKSSAKIYALQLGCEGQKQT